MKTIKHPANSKTKAITKNCFSKYCQQTSSHGWSLFGESRSESSASILSIFWMTVLAVSISATIFFMSFVIQGESFLKYFYFLLSAKHSFLSK